MDLLRNDKTQQEIADVTSPLASSKTDWQIRSAFRRKNHWVALVIFLFMTVSSISGERAYAGENPFEDVDLGTLDPSELVVVTDQPLSIAALDTINVVLPLDLSGTDPILIVLVDPDGSGGDGEVFAVPISLGSLLVDPGDGGPLESVFSTADDVIDELDVGVIPGLQSLLDSLFSGLGGLGGILNPSDLFSLDDIVGQLNESVIMAVGIDSQELVGHTLKQATELLGAEETLKIEAVPERFQPDVRVGKTPGMATHIGNDFYGSGIRQQLRVRSKKRAASKFFASFENDGNLEDTVVGTSRMTRSRKFNSKVLDLSGGGNVSAAFKAGTYRRSLDEGGIVLLRFKDKLNSKGKKRFGRGFKNKIIPNRQVSLRSENDLGRFDAARIKTKFKK